MSICVLTIVSYAHVTLIVVFRYIMSVVHQLVHMACVDDELVAELDSLDPAGFSLLHYCSIFNLNALVPILLAKGAAS